MCEDENMEEKITPAQATTWAQENKTIMAPEGSVDQGRIADLGSAQEVAMAEKPGRDAALGDSGRNAETGRNWVD